MTTLYFIEKVVQELYKVSFEDFSPHSERGNNLQNESTEATYY
jgi:hypothetical protein